MATLWGTGEGLSYSTVTVPAFAVSASGSKMSDPSAGELTVMVCRPPSGGPGAVVVVVGVGVVLPRSAGSASAASSACSSSRTRCSSRALRTAKVLVAPTSTTK